VNTIVTGFGPPITLELVDPTGIKEADFERVALSVLRACHPDAYIFPFHPRVEFDGAYWRPDLALVARNFGYWFIIEVEIMSHHLEKHVIPQARAFNEGVLDNDAVAAIADTLRISTAQAGTFVEFVPRYVAVVGIQHIAISAFRNLHTQETAHGITGTLVVAQESLGFGRVRAVDNAIVTRAEGLPVAGDFQVVSPDGLAVWTAVTTGQQCWLMKKSGRLDFADQSIVQILRRSDGPLILRLPYD
jgi:hypothetical protein